MARPTNQPSALDFRHGSRDRSIIQTVDVVARVYGLVTYWSRTVGVDEKPTYRFVFPDGTSEDGLKPEQAEWLLQGLVTAHRIQQSAKKEA